MSDDFFYSLSQHFNEFSKIKTFKPFARIVFRIYTTVSLLIRKFRAENVENLVKCLQQCACFITWASEFCNVCCVFKRIDDNILEQQKNETFSDTIFPQRFAYIS